LGAGAVQIGHRRGLLAEPDLFQFELGSPPIEDFL
jgi:hypothetical protein